MRLEFDPISRLWRFIKFFVLGLVVSIFIERVLANFLYANFKIGLMDYYWLIKKYIESFNPFSHSHFFADDAKGLLSYCWTWHGTVPAAAILVLSIALGIAADKFFLWYQRTHMQNKK